MAEFTIPHRCKGSLAISEETIEACWDDPAAATHVLAFAAVIAALKGGIGIAGLTKLIPSLEEAARILTGTDENRERSLY